MSEVIELPEVNVYDRDPPPMGETAALDRYNDTRMRDALFRMGASVEPERLVRPPSTPTTLPQGWQEGVRGVAGGMVDYVKRPGQTMERNPYSPGSEEASWWEDQKLKNEDAFARETALNVMGTGGVVGVPVKAGEMALGAGIVRDPSLWSPISAQKLSKPLREMEHQYANVRPPPVPKFVDPASLQGGYGIFTPWDISAIGKDVTHIDRVPLERPVPLHGGVGFQQANPGMAAASEHAISRRLDNDATKLAEQGKTAYIIPITMAPPGVDASHHVANPIAQLVKKAPVTADDMAAFNAEMRQAVIDMEKKKKKVEERKQWLDTTDPGFEDYIANMKGGMTIKALMAKRMALAKWQDKGFPDVAAIRHAVSEPSLIDVPRNTAGMTIARYEPGKGLLETSHPSYPKGVAGHHMGQTATLAPLEDWAPTVMKDLADFNAVNVAAGKQATQPAYYLGRPPVGKSTAQEFNQEWLDNFMKRQAERERARDR